MDQWVRFIIIIMHMTLPSMPDEFHLRSEKVEIYRPIFGFYRYLGIGLSRCWQNAVTFLTHAANLRKKAQQSKSRPLPIYWPCMDR